MCLCRLKNGIVCRHHVPNQSIYVQGHPWGVSRLAIFQCMEPFFMNQGSSNAHFKSSYSCLLGIVVPCFNEELVLPETAKCLKNMLIKLTNSGKISGDSKIYFVDDGSKDSTWKIIESFVIQDKCFSGIKLSRNQGHQRALLAGLLAAEGDALISIDAD